MRNVEKKSTRNNGKKRGLKEKEFQKKNEESSSSIKTMDVNEVEKITLPPSTFYPPFPLIFLQALFSLAFEFYPSIILLFSSQRSRYLKRGRFPFRRCRLAISHVNLLSLTMAFQKKHCYGADLLKVDSISLMYTNKLPIETRKAGIRCISKSKDP